MNFKASLCHYELRLVVSPSSSHVKCGLITYDSANGFLNLSAIYNRGTRWGDSEPSNLYFLAILTNQDTRINMLQLPWLSRS
jgi:hypothetical protein